jgi:DNA repair exonuclease SbcCD ATPase subunit
MSLTPDTELRASIDRQVAAITAALHGAGSTLSADADPADQAAEHRELLRQLAALRDRVARAQRELEEPGVLRAELATLLSFAATLRADVENLQARRQQVIEALARAELVAREAGERLAAEREAALRRRDVLQAKVVQMAEGIARGDRHQCRRTVPVVALDRDVTVCSVGVATPKRRFRSQQFWLVTLTETRDDVLAIRT